MLDYHTFTNCKVYFEKTFVEKNWKFLLVQIDMIKNLNFIKFS